MVILTNDDKWSGGENEIFAQPTLVNFPDNCQTVDLPEEQKKKGTKMVFFTIDPEFIKSLPKPIKLELVIEDRAKATDRRLQRNRLHYNGPTIELDLVRPVGMEYIIELKQQVYQEKDASKGCKNYPTENWKSYNHCDKEKTQERITSIMGSNLVPVWSSQDLSKVSTEHMVGENGSDKVTKLERVFMGANSYCYSPCSKTTIFAKTLSSYPYGNMTHIGLNFMDTIEITTTDFVTPTFATFLSDIGGSLGLWLGMGAVQVTKKTKI